MDKYKWTVVTLKNRINMKLKILIMERNWEEQLKRLLLQDILFKIKKIKIRFSQKENKLYLEKLNQQQEQKLINTI
jgi:hypothetical protein